MEKLSRRSVLVGSGLALGAAALPLAPRAGRAAGPAKKLIVVLASGGWDPTYALDPKPGSTLVDAPDGTIETFAGIPVLTDPGRPSVAGFFRRFAERSLVLNGLQVRSFVHADCMKRVLTGTASDQNPDFGALAADALGRDLPVPYLVLGTSAMSGPLASITGRAGTTNQLSSLLTPSAEDPFIVPAKLEPATGEDAALERYLKAATAREQALRGQHGGNRRELAAFAKSLDRAGLLRRFASERGGFGARGYTPDLMVQVDVALSALGGDLCQVAMLELSNWDTHDDNARQAIQHEDLYAALIHLVEGLDQSGLADRTSVVVLSEMGRTPKLNAARGKDHWPVTSCLVFGAGVRGGRVIGATDAEQNAENADLTTGEASATGSQIQGGNLAAGILELVGIDPAGHFPGITPLRALAG
jgi:hypothetical protein